MLSDSVRQDIIQRYVDEYEDQALDRFIMDTIAADTRNGTSETIQLIESGGIDPGYLLAGSISLIGYAAQFGNYELVNYLYSNFEYDDDVITGIFLMSCSNRHRDIAIFFIDQGIDTKAVLSDSDLPCIIAAIRNIDAVLVKALKESDSGFLDVEAFGQTARDVYRQALEGMDALGYLINN